MLDMVLPSVLMLLSLETIVSAGWDTMAHMIPARYPEAKVTESWVPLLYSALGLAVKTLP